MQLQERDLAYIAGIFDGEGCVCILKENQRKYTLFRIEASIQNTDLALVEYLKTCFGGYVGFRKLSSGKMFAKWCLSCKSAVEFLEKIKPFLRIKKRQAELASEIYSITNLKKRSGIRDEKGRIQKLTEEERNEVNSLRQEIKNLNH